MPFIYVEAEDEFIIEFPEADFMSNWDSPSAESICENYGHPKCTINFMIDNPSDPIQPMYIAVASTEAYEGELISEKLSEKSYKFKIHGKFKTNVHKDTVAAIKEGASPRLDGVTRFREDYMFEDNNKPALKKDGWLFSAKKL
ncbi:hypothetical protein [Lacimonas salitolerans]|uniref:Uncharacterized protein n=1 Tax=Lacimonas salitolerans TaxID=1323750 RepID=A0ABW4EHM3_9RHOB